jgi:5-carboxymethyl-2-hydroxymuconate isomerase
MPACAHPGVPVPEEAQYDDFVRISKEIMRGRSAVKQREVVREVLRSLMPREAPGAFRWDECVCICMCMRSCAHACVSVSVHVAA